MKRSGAIYALQCFFAAFLMKSGRYFQFELRNIFLLGFASLAFLPIFGCADSSKSSNKPTATSSDKGKLSPPKNDQQFSSPQTTLDPLPGKSKENNTARAALKIATYNINYGNPNLAVMGETIRKADADVVCLQETSQDSEAFLLRTFGTQYPYIKFQGHRGQYGAERFGILSRLPVAKYDFLPPKHGLFGAFSAEILWNDRTVQIIAVHLQPVLFPPNARMLDAMKALGTAEKIHRGEMEAILEYSKKEVPTIIAGDFNSGSTFEAPTMLIKAGFVDSFAATKGKPETFSTWHWPTRNGEIVLRIDYIFHSKEFQASEVKVIQSDASDHYLIYSRLEWVDK